jgi:exopolysaccharide biosynthesis WecB/TagA/CpsF family protein
MTRSLLEGDGVEVTFDVLDGSRAERITTGDQAAVEQIRQLVELAQRGLPAAYRSEPVGFAQTVRGLRGPAGTELRPEGRNLRYGAITALGVARLGEEAQRVILGGLTAVDLAQAVAEQTRASRDPGTVAIAAWAAAEVAGMHDAELFGRLSGLLASGDPLPIVDIAWMLTAAVEAADLADTSRVAAESSARLLEAQGANGIFPHWSRSRVNDRWRAAVGCFADQVYPIQALARLFRATDEERYLTAADSTAQRICELQGPAGQWWWHYDSRTGDVLEKYPVYSVHQHAMAPMALFDLVEAGGADHSASVAAGIRWLATHPEVVEELVSERHSLVWRKVGRREPRKAARALSAATAAVNPRLHPPGLDRAFPAVKVDYECRPYELGWLLYGWLPSRPRARRRPEISIPSDASGQQARSRVFGLQLDALTLPEVVDMCESCMDNHSSMAVGVVNAAKVVNLRSNELLRDSLVHCDVLLADGQSVVWASRLLGEPLPERVAGIDLFQALLELGDKDGRSVYLLGAKQEVLELLVEVITARWPGLRIAGCRDGYFNDDEAPEVAAEIAASGADMLFLGMTSPKKEIFLAKYGAELDVPVLHGVGGSFDVLAGVTRRAPVSLQRFGLEWAYRLVQEPRRMWRRYLRTNSAFIGLLLRERVHPTPLYLRTPTVPLGG